MSGLPGRFTEIWNVDFEYRQPDDNSERPWPLCMVAKFVRAGNYASGGMIC